MKRFIGLALFGMICSIGFGVYAGEVPVGIYGTLTGTDTDVNGCPMVRRIS